MASSGTISFGASAVVLSDIASLVWIMCVTLEESLAEMLQYISMTRGMCGVTSQTDLYIKEFVF